MQESGIYPCSINLLDPISPLFLPSSGHEHPISPMTPHLASDPSAPCVISSIIISTMASCFIVVNSGGCVEPTYHPAKRTQNNNSRIAPSYGRSEQSHLTQCILGKSRRLRITRYAIAVFTYAFCNSVNLVKCSTAFQKDSYMV